MSLDLNDVSLFAAVAEAGGFRVAAQRRGASASSLSEAVRRLEAELGVRLLNRTTRSVTPTEAGARLLDRVRPALLDIAEAARGAAADASTPTGTLRLNIPSIVARHVMPGIAARFLLAHPGIRLDVVVEDSFVDVLAGGFDAGIRYEESIARDMIAVPIGPAEQHFAAAASPAYLAVRGVPKHPRDLADYSRIAHRFPNGNLGVWEFERGTRRVRLAPDGPLTCGSIDMARAAALAGLGVIRCFEDDVRADLETGALVELLRDWQQPFTGPRLYYHSRRHMPAPLRAFIDFVRAEGTW
jgi:DNA-binding transcriptional LysR family regulator